jgi:hypothetical protein
MKIVNIILIMSLLITAVAADAANEEVEIRDQFKEVRLRREEIRRDSRRLESAQREYQRVMDRPESLLHKRSTILPNGLYTSPHERGIILSRDIHAYDSHIEWATKDKNRRLEIIHKLRAARRLSKVGKPGMAGIVMALGAVGLVGASNELLANTNPAVEVIETTPSAAQQ